MREQEFITTKRVSNLPKTKFGAAVLTPLFDILREEPYSISSNKIVFRPGEIASMKLINKIKLN
jgi:hypothetical protein